MELERRDSALDLDLERRDKESPRTSAPRESKEAHEKKRMVMLSKMTNLVKSLNGYGVKLYEPSVMRVVAYMNANATPTESNDFDNKTRRSSAFKKKNLTKQANKEQLRAGNQLYRLIQKYPNLLKNILGSILKETNTPFRYIFVLIKKGEDQNGKATRFLAALVSATKKAGSDPPSAIVDTVVPVTKDLAEEDLRKLIGYTMMKMLWLNNKGEINKGKQKYTFVEYKGKLYSSSDEVERFIERGGL
jgi:hypothetical protein